jgi:cysteine-rich repeat protein
MTLRNRFACVVTTLAVMAMAASAHADFSDDFDDPARDGFWSHIALGSGPTASEPGGVLQLTTPAGSTGGLGPNVLNIYRSNCTFGGDFDATVTFNALTTPTDPNRSWGVNLQAFSTGGAPIFGVNLGFNPGVGLRYGSGAGIVSTTDTTGRLRFQRSVGSGTAHAYYWDTSDWVEIGTGFSFTTAPVYLALLTVEGNNIVPLEDLTATFDDFAVVGGQDCPYESACGNHVLDAGETCDPDPWNDDGSDGCCACVSNPPLAADLSGGWQLRTTCNDGTSVTTRPVTITQDAGSNSGTLTLAGCGTFTSEGHSEVVTSCPSVPHAVEICANRFSYGPLIEESTFPGFPVSFGCADLAQTTVNAPRYEGTFTVDGSNRATAVSGTYKPTSVALYNEGTAEPCLDVSGAFLTCTYEMRRNVATAANPTVEPVPNVTVTFAPQDLASPITVLVTPDTTPVGAVPAGFLALGQYFEISSVSGATPTGTITVCLPYGSVDPADVRIGHENGATYDVLNVTIQGDVACADVTHLSQFAVLAVSQCGNGAVQFGEECDDGNLVDDDCCTNDCHATTNACPDDGTPCTDDVCQNGACTHPVPARSCDQALAGKASLALKRSDDGAKNGVNWKWTSEGELDVASLGDDAATTDLTFCLSDRDGLVLSARAPAGGTCATKPCWVVDTGKGKLKYGDKELSPDGLAKIQGKSGLEGKGKLAVQGRGPNLALPARRLHLPVHADLIRTDDDGCWGINVSQPSSVQKSDDHEFKAKAD